MSKMIVQQTAGGSEKCYEWSSKSVASAVEIILGVQKE